MALPTIYRLTGSKARRHTPARHSKLTLIGIRTRSIITASAK